MNKPDIKGECSRGFTLIELMVALAISAIVMMALIQVFSSQQRTFSQQSDLANTQSLARNALFQMARDIRMAGYTGIPLGTDKLVNTGNDYFPVLSVADGGTWINTLGGGTMAYVSGMLVGMQKDAGWSSDAIEIRGNFMRRSANLASLAAVGDDLIVVDDIAPFAGQSFNRPGWVIIGRSFGGITVNMGEVVSVDDGANTIEISPPLGNEFLADTYSFVAPIFSRVYSLNEDTRELLVGNYNPNAPAIADVTPLATSINDFQITYNTYEGIENQIAIGRNMICNPCQVRSVELRLWTRSEVYRPENRPLIREFSNLVRIRNIGFTVESCEIALGCGWQY